MDKLIELLNEYEGPEFEHTIIDGNVKRRVKNIVDPDKPYKWCSIRWYSKSFGFIKWLVDNDKIDKEKVWENESPDIFDYSFYEVVLMLLSIQDNQIQFLCEILK